MANEFNLGINLGAIEYYEEGLPFKDLMKNGRHFRADNVTNVPGYEGTSMRVYHTPSSFPELVHATHSNRIDLGVSSDGDGYPLARYSNGGSYVNPYKPLLEAEIGHVSGALPFSSVEYSDKAIIHIYYDGDYAPTLSRKLNGVDLQPATVFSSTTGEVCCELENTTTYISIAFASNNWNGASAIANHTRNIRVVHQDYKDNYLTDPFVPASKNLAVSATTSGGPIRNLDWGKINNSPISSVSQLISKDSHAQGSRYGISWEYMAEYANQVDRPLWVCLPHLAGRDVLSAIASTLYNTLDSDKELYVEYSNETWNAPGFEQANHLNRTANNSPLSSTFELPYIASQSDRSRGRGLGVLSSLQVFDVFENYFPPERLVRVQAHQKTGTSDGFMKGMLLYNNAYSSVDMWAIAPYAGNYLGNRTQATSSVSAWTKDDVFDWLYETVSGEYIANAPSGSNADAISGVPAVLSSTEIYNGTALGDLFSAISPGCYESGQHLNVRKSGVTNQYGDAQRELVFNTIAYLFSSCQDDSRMADWYEWYYNYLKDKGFKTVCGFVDVGGWGISYAAANADFWGLLPYYGYTPPTKLIGAKSFVDSQASDPPDPPDPPDPTPPPALATEQLGYRIDINVDININFN